MCTLDAKCENVISIGSKHPEVIADSAGLKQRELVKDIDMKDADAEGGWYCFFHKLFLCYRVQKIFFVEKDIFLSYEMKKDIRG